MHIKAEKSSYHIFALYYDYNPKKVEFCRALKETHGWQNFTFNSEQGLKRWVFSDPVIVREIVNAFPDTLVDPEVARHVAAEFKHYAAMETQQTEVQIVQQKTDTNITIKGIKGELYPYQKVGVEFLIASGGRAIVADPPGLGKSIQSIAYALYEGLEKILVICPASVKSSWQKELRRWAMNTGFITLSGKPTPQNVDALTSFLSLTDHVGLDSLQKIQDIHRSDKVPSILCFTGLDDARAFVEVANISFPAQISKEINHTFVGIVDNNGNFFSLVGCDNANRSLSIDNTGHVSNKSFVFWHKDRDLLSFGSTVSSKEARDLCIGKTSKNTDFTVSVTSLKEMNSLINQGFRCVNLMDLKHKFVLMNYDIAKTWSVHYTTLKMQLMVLDESQLVKSRTAQRTKAVMFLSKLIEKVILLSGTPLLSRPVEMYTLLNMVDPRTWNNWYDFTRRYCGGHQGRFGYETGGATNTEELHERIKRHFIRRQKKDVLTQLPPKVRIDMPVELSPEMARQYSAAEEDLASFLMMYKGKQPAEVAKMVAAEQLAKLNILRQITALGKIPTAKDLIESILEAGEKVLVFSSFMEPLRQLQAAFPAQSVMITGETSVQDRGAIVTRFQEDPNTQIFFGGIRSAGVGITLTAAANVIFLDYSWTPADMQQAEDRVHRPGQEAQSVNIYQLHAEGTIDGRLLKLLKQKQIIFDKVIEGVAVLKEDQQATKQAFRDVVEDVMERNKKDTSVVSVEEFESLFGKVQ